MFTEDLTPFFSTADFGLAATYNGATAVTVIFDSAYLESLGIAGTNPVALGKASDFAAPVGKTLLISSTTYTIRNFRALDDGAVVVLELEKP